MYDLALIISYYFVINTFLMDYFLSCWNAKIKNYVCTLAYIVKNFIIRFDLMDSNYLDIVLSMKRYELCRFGSRYFFNHQVYRLLCLSGGLHVVHWLAYWLLYKRCWESAKMRWWYFSSMYKASSIAYSRAVRVSYKTVGDGPLPMFKE